MKTMAYYSLSDTGGPKYYRLSSFSLCQGHKEQKSKPLCEGKRIRSGLHSGTTRSVMGPSFSSTLRRLVHACFLLFLPLHPPANDSGFTEKGSKQQELKTKALVEEGDSSDPVPSTFLVSHLLATPLSLPSASHPLTSSGKA